MLHRVRRSQNSRVSMPNILTLVSIGNWLRSQLSSIFPTGQLSQDLSSKLSLVTSSSSFCDTGAIQGMAQTGGDPAANLQELFASLRPSGSGSSVRQSEGTHQSSDRPSRTFSQHPPQRNPSQYSQHIMSQPYSPSFGASPSRDHAHHHRNQTPTGDNSKDDRTANLLNLLNFNNLSSSPQSQSQPQSQQGPSTALRQTHGTLAPAPSAHSIHGRGISASDLVASFMGSKPSAPASRETTPAPSSGNHQDLLLSLLNRASAPQPPASKENLAPQTPLQETNVGAVTHNLAKTALEGKRPSGPTAKESSQSARKESPIRIFGSKAEDSTPFEPEHLPKPEALPKRNTTRQPGSLSGSPAAATTKKDPIFTYVNPFEQLAASSPRNLQTKPPNGDGQKRKSKESSPAPVHASSRRKITPAGEEILQSIESPAPVPLDDGRTQIEALIGIGAPTQNTETVAEALNEVGDKVNKEVENALAEAEVAEAEAKADEKERQAEVKKEELERAQEKTIQAMAESAHDVAVQVKQELDKDENKGLLEESLTTPVANVVKEIIDEAAQGDAHDEWESADAAETRTKGDTDQIVKVYQFPLKPFVSITVTPKHPPELGIPPASVLDVARFKKEFDQIDRTLATATTEFIAYSIVKPGGIRIIRQDDGADRQLFSGAKDRMFNICFSIGKGNAPLRGTQNVVATGVSGSVYWATVTKADGLPFEADLMEKTGLIIPPSASQTESTSTGQLKTRAKKSSRHPGFFAIGRGKLIHIIFPFHARRSKFVNEDSVLDTDGYLQERTLKISTGKAGKDFTFSEDDTAIITLDKAGRLRFWDITELIDESNGSASRLAPIDVKSPLQNLATTHPSQKSWPTSVMFLDKSKAYQKGIAQRYLIVGMKQNHTLQLWDLGLGKAIQELSFPHEKEDDPICSISYHPPTSIIVVGHPTRNSLYFVHLSAPRYTLPSMSQATYLKKVFSGGPSVYRTDLTAIMSGLREYSFASKGQLRSVDLVPSPGVEDEDDPTLFELYITHSRGVTCLSIKKQDLGWSQDNKVLNPINAEKVGEIVVKDVPSLLSGPLSETKQSNGDSLPSSYSSSTPKSQKARTESAKAAPSSAIKSEDAKPEAQGTPQPSVKLEKPTPDATSSAISDKGDKKKKKRRIGAAEDQPNVSDTPAETPAVVEPQAGPVAPESVSKEGRSNVRTASRDNTPAPQATKTQTIANGESINLGISGDFLDKELKKIETGVSKEFKQVLGRELEGLYRRIDDDKRVQDAAGAAKQDAMLRLVSSTLSGNVDKALARIIEGNIRQSVIPAIADVLASILDQRLSEALAKQLHNAIPAHLKLALPEAVNRSMQQTEVLRILSDQITGKISGHVEKEFSSVLHNNIAPAFKNLALNVAQKTSSEVESRVREQLKAPEVQQRKDTAKVDELSSVVRGLSDIVHTMAASQSEFQQEILKLQSQAAQERQALAIRETSRQHQETSPSSGRSVLNSITPEQAEVNAISAMMGERRYEEATIQVSTADPFLYSS